MPGLPSTLKASTGSVLKRRKAVVEIDEKTYKIKALLTGPSGGGKSTGAVTIPGNKLVIDLEDRSASLVSVPNLEIVQINETDASNPTAWKELNLLKDELWTLARSEKGLPWNTVVIDGCTRLGRYAMNEALQLTETQGKRVGQKMRTAPGGGPLWEKHYAPQMNFMATFIMQMIPLPCHVIFTAHLDMYENKKLNTLDIYPKFLGNIRSEVASWFNETYLCEYEEKYQRYVWKTLPFKRYTLLKSSLNTQGKYWSEDIIINLDESPCGFEKLLKMRFEK